ncbi:hypothetical protein JOF48_000332 [Arthrobacter stackebrandtii]|uniref:O-antigen ligase domain-containing protein n=1 Tax=Arthrobacter stackebrandtii TaxID=272161 RepID=A0ABS4YRW5_9MICC|nr:hypothetical protein [Arthrobacter stackebrandtii]MBP2411533.1 hypothetical protein [Arthrobacter stackebrandtii]PYG98501.1 hypothetical protein CVV67_20505 [Arthrobacter stackebrandtii]
MISIFIGGAVALFSIFLLLRRSYHLLLLLIIASGWAQASLLSITESSAFQLIDDVPVAVLIAAAVPKSLTSNRKCDSRAFVLFALLLALVAVGVLRSPDVGVGMAQARQVLLPFGLIFAGYVFRAEIPWRKVRNYLVLFTGLTVAWVLLEEFLQKPLIDPTWYYVEAIGGDSRGLRQGLPPAYFADGVGGETVFRPGGPYMNPPVMGFMVGLGAYAAVAQLRGVTKVVFLVLAGMALYFSYARAGILIFAVVTIIYFIWVKVGKSAGILVGLLLGGYMIATFLEQGATASHSDGLVTGFIAGARSPFGQGFGTTGYQAALEGTSTGVGSESLLGLYLAWLGWPMIIALVVFVIQLLHLLRKTPRVNSLQIWTAIAFLLTVASSESASSMASTPILWLISGSVLAMTMSVNAKLRDKPQVSRYKRSEPNPA